MHTAHRMLSYNLILSIMKIRISGMYTAWFRYKMSGSGREGGQYGLEAYTEVWSCSWKAEEENLHTWSEDQSKNTVQEASCFQATEFDHKTEKWKIHNCEEQGWNNQEQ